MTTTRSVFAIAVVLALAGGLTACSPRGGPAPAGDPEADPPASASPSASAEPTEEPSEEPSEPADPPPAETPDWRDRITSLAIDGDSVNVRVSEGGNYLEILYTSNPEVAVDLISDAIGLAAVRSTLAANTCFHERTQATWGGLSIIWGEDWQRATEAQFIATSTSPETTNGYNVAGPAGAHVGAPWSRIGFAYPDAYLDDFGAWKSLHYDVANGTPTTPDDYWGAIAIVEDDVLTSFSSPINFFYDC